MKPVFALLAMTMLSGATPAVPTDIRIDLNQIGYAPDASKIAIVRTQNRESLAWRVVDAGGGTVASGRTLPLPVDPRAGDRQHRIDFSALTVPGEGYRLHVDAVQSPAFAIRAAPYRALARDALAFFYHQRAGTPIEAHFAGGDQWARPAAHVGERVTCFSGKDTKGNDWPGCDHHLDVTGGWYDAGDHGKYVVNGGISVWTLLNLHEWMREAFPDGSQQIPEAGNGVPDLLDEIRWQMEFMLSMQVPDGTWMRLPTDQRTNSNPLTYTQADVGGMAHHKVADERWTAIPMRPDRDPERRFLYPPSTAATLNLAAVAAQCARAWAKIDPAFSRRCLNAATRAWAAAERNPQAFAVGDFPGSGNYGDDDVSDEVFWAASELYATTGDARFRDAITASPHYDQGVGGEHGWPATAPLGHATLAIAERVEPEIRAHARAAITTAADRFERERKGVAYRIPYASDRYSWGSNSNLLNRAMLLLMANRWAPEARYQEAAGDVMDYLLGRNPLGQSYVSGHGTHPMLNPHHRFWAKQSDATYPGPPPGALSGGPNNTAMIDPVALKLKGECAPQRCWADHIDAYALNEVAINWNAPLVWVAAVIENRNGR